MESAVVFPNLAGQTVRSNVSLAPSQSSLPGEARFSTQSQSSWPAIPRKDCRFSFPFEGRCWWHTDVIGVDPKRIGIISFRCSVGQQQVVTVNKGVGAKTYLPAYLCCKQEKVERLPQTPTNTKTVMVNNEREEDSQSSFLRLSDVCSCK